MSAPMKLTAEHLRTIAEVLDLLTKTSQDTKIDFIGPMGMEITYAGNTLRLGYENDQYIIDEYPGC